MGRPPLCLRGKGQRGDQHPHPHHQHPHPHHQHHQHHQQQQSQASQGCTEAEPLAGRLPPGRLSPLPVRGCSAAAFRRGAGPTERPRRAALPPSPAPPLRRSAVVRPRRGGEYQSAASASVVSVSRTSEVALYDFLGALNAVNLPLPLCLVSVYEPERSA